MTWHWLTYENGMDHVVSDELIEAIRNSMANADPPGILKANKVIAEIAIDRPGIVYVDRPWTQVSFRGLTLKIPCEDVRALLDRWLARDLDVALGRSFYRFIGHPWRCLVVDPEQREELIGILADRVEDAERRAEAFFTDRDYPSQVLRDHNQQVHGISPSDAIYAPDARARFRSPKEN